MGPPRPKRASWGLLGAFVAGALMLASPAFAKLPAIVPGPTLTPGAVRTTDRRKSAHRHAPAAALGRARDDRIYGRYGLRARIRIRTSTLDHLIPLGIGGADDEANLWPEPRRSVEPSGTPRRKDQLERRLRDSDLRRPARRGGGPAHDGGGLGRRIRAVLPTSPQGAMEPR